jgi:lantibiotic biosynthesis protein
MAPSLFSGFSGVGWAAQHITDLLADPSEDLNSEIDLAVIRFLDCDFAGENYDLINGLVGLGVYCMERRSSPVARQCLERIVQHLSQLGKKSGEGVCWFTNPAIIPELRRGDYPDGYYDLGVAHGIPGVIGLLGKIYAAGIATDVSGRLLEEAVHWLLSHRLPQGSNSHFTAFVADARPMQECRLAWCYGDAGVAAVLLLAARCAGKKTWELEAITIARQAATRDPDAAGVADVCLCHGSTGLAHIFNRFFQATHEKIFAESSRYWIERTLQFRETGRGAAGYSVLAADANGNIAPATRCGFLDGIAGVGLALLAATTNVEPSWDRVLLVDILPLVSNLP